MTLDHEDFCLLVPHKSKFSSSLDLMEEQAQKDPGSVYYDPITLSPIEGFTHGSVGTNKALHLISTFEKSKEFILRRNTMEFLKEDVANLISSVERTGYIVEQFPKCSERQGFEMSYFNRACSSIGIDNISLEIGLSNFRKYCSKANRREFNDNVNEGRVHTAHLEDHPCHGEIVSKLSNVFEPISHDDINFVCKFASENESLALVCLEPHMIFVLGSALFTKVIYPLHRAGGFKYIINQVKLDYLEKKKTLKTLFLENIFRKYSLINRILYSLINLLPVGVDIFSSYDIEKKIEEEIIESPEEETISLGDSIRALPKPEGLPGFAGEVAERTREVIGQISVEVGRGLGVATRGIAGGFVEKNQEAVAIAADMVDCVISHS